MRLRLLFDLVFGFLIALLFSLLFACRSAFANIESEAYEQTIQVASNAVYPRCARTRIVTRALPKRGREHFLPFKDFLALFPACFFELAGPEQRASVKPASANRDEV